MVSDERTDFSDVVPIVFERSLISPVVSSLEETLFSPMIPIRSGASSASSPVT